MRNSVTEEAPAEEDANVTEPVIVITPVPAEPEIAGVVTTPVAAEME
jgi:hypothetical protein